MYFDIDVRCEFSAVVAGIVLPHSLSIQIVFIPSFLHSLLYHRDAPCLADSIGSAHRRRGSKGRRIDQYTRTTTTGRCRTRTHHPLGTIGFCQEGLRGGGRMIKVRTGPHHGHAQCLQIGLGSAASITGIGGFIDAKGWRIDKKAYRLGWWSDGNQRFVVQGCWRCQMNTGSLANSLFVPTGLGNFRGRHKETRSRACGSGTAVAIA